MPKLLDFSELHPDIEVHVANSIKPADFEKEDVDLAIRVGTVEADVSSGERPRIDLVMAKDWAHLQAEVLLADELVAVASPQYFAEFGEISTPDQMNNVSLLHMATRPNAWSDFFKAIGWEPKVRSDNPSYGHFFMTLQAAIQGRGIALVPHILAEADIQMGSLVQVMPQRVKSEGSYFLIGRKRSWDQGKIKIFREWLHNEVELRNRPTKQPVADT